MSNCDSNKKDLEEPKLKRQKRDKTTHGIVRNEQVETQVTGDDIVEDDSDNEDDDPFNRHFLREPLGETVITELNKRKPIQSTLNFCQLKNCTRCSYENVSTTMLQHTSLNNFYIKQVLQDNIHVAIRRCKGVINQAGKLTDLQMELMSIIGGYQDLLYTERSTSHGEEIRLVYCLHAMNHILKTRAKVTRHNTRLKQGKEMKEEFRDQGLARPKVLIIVPFRESALRVVNLMVSLLLPSKKANVTNKKRFKEEFCSPSDEQMSIGMTKKRLGKPDDFLSTFSGNVDDSFRVGFSVTRKSIKLYSDFYKSDAIIASPLGLKLIIGSEGERNSDYDFLSSIELVVVDQAEVLLMQNWEHLLHVFAHLHLQPKGAHETDFGRVRMWTLEGQSKYFRQTLVFSSVNVPAVRGLLGKHANNFEGKVLSANLPNPGTISQVVVQMPQMFHRFDCHSVHDCPNNRFDFFISKVLPHFRDASVMSHTLIFVPSYFDFVRLRNYFKKEDISFNQICEYTKGAKVSRARDLFYQGQGHFLIYTERAHFYHRYVIKGVRHVIFYELPIHPHYYSEVANYLRDNLQVRKSQTVNHSCTSIYSNYDATQLAAVVGHNRASQMVNANKKLHMFVTDKLHT